MVNLSPIYSFLQEKGVKISGEYLIVDEVPVQFLVPYNPFVEAAVKSAVLVKFMDVEVRIPPPRVFDGDNGANRQNEGSCQIVGLVGTFRSI